MEAACARTEHRVRRPLLLRLPLLCRAAAAARLKARTLAVLPLHVVALLLLSALHVLHGRELLACSIVAAGDLVSWLFA